MQNARWNQICSELENSGKESKSDRSDTLREELHILEHSKQQSLYSCEEPKLSREQGPKEKKRRWLDKPFHRDLGSDMVVSFSNSLSKVAAIYERLNVPSACTRKEVDTTATGFHSETSARTRQPHVSNRKPRPRRSLRTMTTIRRPRTFEGAATHLDLSMELPAPSNNSDFGNNEEDARYLAGLLFLAPNKEEEIRMILGASCNACHCQRIVPERA